MDRWDLTFWTLPKMLGELRMLQAFLTPHLLQNTLRVRSDELIKNWLSHFAAISVREETTAPLFQPLSPMPIQICLDPTLLLDAEDYAALRAESTRVDSISFDDKLFVYMLERNDEMVSKRKSLP